MNQALARASDPITSHNAAAKVRVTRLERFALIELATHGPLTSGEIAACTNTPRDSISPRMRRLEEKGLAFDTGLVRIPERFGVVGHREQIVWGIQAAGTELVKDEVAARSARGNYDPHETPEARAARLVKVRAFVDAVNPTSGKNDVLESLQDARDAINAIAEDIGETRRVGTIQDALSSADTEIVRLEKALSAARDNAIEACAKVCEEFMPTVVDDERHQLQRNTLENVALSIRNLKGRS